MTGSRAGTTIVMSGASGFLGAALRAALDREGARVVPLVRRSPSTGEIGWNPAEGILDPAALEGADAVIHLAGESIGGGLWTAERRRRIRESRVQGTALLAGAIASLGRRPAVMLSTSAVGIYGDRGEETLTEQSPPGTGFLAEVAQAWEAAAEPARSAGIRVVHPRLGVILHPSGGMLQRVLLPFRIGLGGPLGGGAHWMSWLSLDDAVGIYRFLLDQPDFAGPVNATAPTPVTNAEFTRELASALGRPAFLAAPRAALELFLGDMARELLLASTRAVPARLEASGYQFAHPTLASVLELIRA